LSLLEMYTTDWFRLSVVEVVDTLIHEYKTLT
jgi:hypothetical protein